MLPEFVKSAILWSIPRQEGLFVVAFSSGSLAGGAGRWLLAAGCQVSHSALVPGGTAFLLFVPPALAPSFKQLRSGGMGSRHPVNFLPF
jgi:hypothetical protein